MADSVTVDVGQNVKVEITADNFMGVASIQLSHNYDSTVLEFVGLTDIHSSLGGLSAQGSQGGVLENGDIVVNWFEQSGTTVDIPNGTVLYALEFTAIGNECDSSEIATSSDPREIEVLDENLNNLPYTTRSGQVKINGTDCVELPDVTFRLNTATGSSGTEVCLELKVDGFIDVESFQWSLKWDHSVATFSQVNNLNLTSLDVGDFNYRAADQALVCIWDEASGGRVTVNNGTRIANICFNLVGSDGDMTDVVFSTTPIPTEVTRQDDNNMGYPAGVRTQQGKLTIKDAATDSVELILCDVTGLCNTRVCMPVKVMNFNDVNSFQFSMTLPNGVELADPNSQNHALPGFSTSKVSGPAPGVVRVLWDELSGGGQTLGDGAVLFEICLIAQDAGQYFIDFSDTPLKIEVVDANVNTLDVKTTGATLSITCDEGVSVTLMDTLKARCATFCRGYIGVNVAGGSGSYDISWTENGVSRPDLEDQTFGSNLCGGDYRIIVCDRNAPSECDTLFVSLFKPDSLKVSNVNMTPALNGCDGALELTVTGGVPNYFYNWGAAGNNQRTNPAVDLCKGNYVCTISDIEGCTLISDTLMVTGEPIVIQTPVITEPTCNGDCDGAIRVTASGGCGPLSYTWSGNGVNPNAQNQTSLCAGQYKVVVRDTMGGMEMLTINLTEPDAIVIELDSIQNGDPGSIYIQVMGGTVVNDYTYKWTDLSGSIISQDQDLLNESPGTYIIMAIDDRGCMSVDTFIISDRDLDVAINLALTNGGTHISCNGECDGMVNVVVTQGSGSYSYRWSHDPAETSNMIDDLCAGTYKVTVMDLVMGSTAVRTFDVNEPDILSVSIVKERCASSTGARDGAYRAVPSGGVGNYEYLWCNNSTSAVPTNLEGGALCNVLVTDDNGCQVFEGDFEICDDGRQDSTECFNGRLVITPNDDNTNEELRISCLDDPNYQNNELFIFNRRGQLINQYKNYNNQWRGLDEGGELVTEDVYMWVLKITLPSGVREVYRGTVTVIYN